MISLLLALALVAQTAPTEPPPQPPLESDGRVERSLSPAHDVFYEDSAPETPEALAAAHDFGSCVADASALRARGLLQRDFTTRSYLRDARRLMNEQRPCFERRGSMRSATVLILGAMAERLIERESDPVNVQLARAALRQPLPGFSPSDRAAICVVRSVPDDVARLFATNVAGPAEAQAAASLKPVLSACLGQQPVEISDAGLRAILATAAFREIHSETPPVVEDRR